MKLLTVFVVAGLLLYVAERVDIVRLGYQIERLKSERATLQRERDELRVKASKLSSPERIAHAATEKLGMAPPLPGQVVHVRVGTPASPAGGTGPSEVQLARNLSAHPLP